MIYAVLYQYSSDKDKIASVRPSHRQHLTKLLQSGNLLAAGPITDDSGALIVYNAADEVELNRFIAEDPFNTAGIFQSWQVKPWKVVFGNRTLLPDGGP